MRLGDTKFFNLFALLATASNPGRKDCWQCGEVSWSRERSTLRTAHYSYQLELHVLRRGGRRPWTLLAAHETWWDQKRKDAFRNGRWVHLSEGTRQDVLKWFAAREAELERKT